MWLFHVVVCKERQRDEQRIITHAYRTVIVLVAVAVEVCLFKNSLKLNKRQNNEQPNKHNSNEGPGEQNDV